VSVQHTDVAAYALGLLSEEDRQEFEGHLASCEACAAELGEFAAMADLFAGLDAVQATTPEPDPVAVADLLSRRAAIERRRNRQRGLLAAAACLVLLAVGVVAGVAVTPHKGTVTSVVQLTGVLHTATNPTTGLTATVGLVSHPWGTEAVLKLGHVRGPLKCELIAVSKTGLRRVMVGWLVPAVGYGVPGHPGDLLIEGGTWIKSSQLSSIEIQVLDGPTLLTIPV
jgi:putative zinc finger protein